MHINDATGFLSKVAFAETDIEGIPLNIVSF